MYLLMTLNRYLSTRWDVIKVLIMEKYIRKERLDDGIKQKLRAPQYSQHSTVYFVYIGVGFAWYLFLFCNVRTCKNSHVLWEFFSE